MSNIKNKDEGAKRLFGEAYEKIPKSVFAVMAWHFANAASGIADTPGAAEEIILTELFAVMEAGYITEAQSHSAKKAILKLRATMPPIDTWERADRSEK